MSMKCLFKLWERAELPNNLAGHAMIFFVDVIASCKAGFIWNKEYFYMIVKSKSVFSSRIVENLNKN